MEVVSVDVVGEAGVATAERPSIEPTVEDEAK
jgi:hypothetical protein